MGVGDMDAYGSMMARWLSALGGLGGWSNGGRMSCSMSFFKGWLPQGTGAWEKGGGYSNYEQELNGSCSILLIESVLL